MKMFEESHSARNPQFGHPWYIMCMYCNSPLQGVVYVVHLLQFCHSSVRIYCACAVILSFKGLCMLYICYNSAIQAFCTWYACAAMLPLKSLCMSGHVLHLYVLCMCCKFRWNEFNWAGRLSTVNVLCNDGNLIKCYLKNAWYPLAQILHLRGNDEQTCMYVM